MVHSGDSAQLPQVKRSSLGALLPMELQGACGEELKMGFGFVLDLSAVAFSLQSELCWFKVEL